jgi:peptide/nickel transport system substrate-binding protein
LKKCGYPEGFEVTMAYLNIGIGAEIFRSIQSSLARVGIVVAPKRFDNYTKFISVTRNPEQLTSENIALVVSGVQSQLHSPLDFWSEITDGRLIKPFGNENIALIDVATINNALDNLVTQPSQSQQLSAEINNQVMQRAVYLPYAYDRIMLYRNPKVVGIYVQQALGGQYDLVNVGLAK